MTNPMRKWIMIVAGLALLGALALGVLAAAETDSEDGQATFDQRGGGRGGPQGGPGFQGGGDPFQGGPGFQGGMPGMGQGGPPMGGGAGGPAIAVADGKVFVVLGPTIYKFDAGSLALEAQTTFIERPAGQMAPGGPAPGQ